MEKGERRNIELISIECRPEARLITQMPRRKKVHLSQKLMPIPQN